MIRGIGVDIVKIERIQQAVERFGDRFLQRVFCPNEIKKCLKKNDPYPCLAGRFAAKEAFVKALGTGFRHGIRLKDICTMHDNLGAPKLILENKALEIFEQRHLLSTFLSISHDADVAVATVVIEGRGNI